MKIKVYFNLHRKLFSVVALEGPRKGLVIAHERSLILTDATFKVSEAGRQRVLREQRKNVHAFVVGQWWEHPWMENLGREEVTYNPYKFSTFVKKESLEPIHRASCVWLENKKVWALDVGEV